MNFINQSKSSLTVLIFLFIFLCTAQAALSQIGSQSAQTQGAAAGQSTKGAIIKGKAPVDKKPLNVKLPRPQEATLPNGLRVVLIENHKIPTFSLQMVVLSGGLSDATERPGTASFVAPLLREGTLKRTEKQISEQLAALGATLNGSSSLNGFTSSVSSQGLIENFDQTLDIFADAIQNPQFPAAELERFKAQFGAQIQFQRSNPQLLALVRLNQASYGSHPAAKILPPPEAVKSLTSEQLKQFHQTFYRPNNAILTVTGDITMNDLLPKIKQAFGGWQKEDVPGTRIPEVSSLPKAGISLIDRPGSVQTVLYLGNLSIKRTDEDFFALTVMNYILGGGAAGRLFNNLREDKGYTYGAYSNLTTSKYPGMIVSSAEVRTEVTDGALKEFMYEIRRLRDERVSAVELENAKRGLTGGFAFSLESPQTLLSNVVTQKLYDLPADYWDTYPQRVAAVTPEDVQRAARKYLDLSSLQIVAVGDASKIRDSLAKYGTVKQYDVEGKEVDFTGVNTPK